MKVCCVTGHRDIPADRLETVTAELRHAVLQAVSDGYYTFVSGFTQGTGLIAADIVAEMKAVCRLRLVAALPYYGALRTTQRDFWRLLRQCDAVEIVNGSYHSHCHAERNQYMVDMSARVIALYDGRENGGTYAMLNYARERQRDIRMILLERAVPCA